MAPKPSPGFRCFVAMLAAGAFAFTASATPANKAALVKHYDKFLPKSLNACTTCHLPSEKKHPETLADFPHNPFGDRLRKLGEEAEKAGKKLDIPHRLAEIAKEDADKDGVVKYELVWSRLNNSGQRYDGIPDTVQGVALAQVLPDRKLKFEAFPGKTGADVSGFTGAAKIYER